MKKTIFITIGAILLIAILGIWIYLFMYGTPKNSDEVFARFGIGGENTIPTELIGNQNTIAEENSLPEVTKKLRQLSLRPVAGATFTGTGVLYVEQGTGHIYHMNFGSGAETLISGTTIPKAREATFSLGGAYVAITATRDNVPETVVGSVTIENGSGSLDGVSLPLGAKNIHFDGGTSTLMYTLTDSSGTSGYSYDLMSEKGTQIFTVPLRDVRVIWGDTIFAYTTPSATQQGYVYKVSENNLEYVTSGGFGLMSFPYANGIVVTKNDGNTLSSYAITDFNKTFNLPPPLISEKCTSGKNFIYCGMPFEIQNIDSFPDDWYKGSVSYRDTLWSVNIEKGEAALLSDFLSESGREIDVRQIGANEDGTYIYFINKNDNSLWMFDTTL